MSRESFLLTSFRELYAEVVRWKEKLHREMRTEAGKQETSPREVWDALLGLLERQAIAVRRTGGEYAAELYREAQYVMAALADEVFLHLDWDGREIWRGNLLETRLFGTQRAGDLIFDRIEAILRTRDPLQTELGKVYLLALALGFQGRYRSSGGGAGGDGEARLLGYRRALYGFVGNVDPDAPADSRALLPEAYVSTVEAADSRRLPNARRWVTAAVLLLLLWAGVSHFVWLDLTREMREVMEGILEPIDTPPADSGGASSTS